MKPAERNRGIAILRVVFWFGAVADGLIAIEWYWISLGLVDISVHPSFLVGEGSSFRTSDHRSVSVGYGSGVPPAGSRRCLWKPVSEACQEPGYRRSTHCHAALGRMRLWNA